MKITLIGHFCIDVFHQDDGTEVREFGGIYHAVAAMANLASDRDVLYPVFTAGANEFEEIVSALSVYKNINVNGILKVGETNFVHYYGDEASARSHNIQKPIPYLHVRNFLNVDGIYINMISGSDITIDTLDEIRLDVRPKKIPIHIDLHCLTFHVNEDGTRYHRPVSDWRRWCFMTNSVQLNEEEAAGISLEKFSDELLAKQMTPLMVEAFVITRGAKGITLFQSEHKHSIRNDYSGKTVKSPVSVIGSGDIFGAAFLFSFLKLKKYEDAAQFALKAAGMTTQYSLKEKHQYLAQLKQEL